MCTLHSTHTAVRTDIAKFKLELGVPLYTILIACVNFAFDSVDHKLDLSAVLFHIFCKVSANCNTCIYTAARVSDCSVNNFVSMLPVVCVYIITTTHLSTSIKCSSCTPIN